MTIRNARSMETMLRCLGAAVLFVGLQLSSSDTRAGNCPTGGCRAEITGWHIGNGPKETDNLHLDAGNIAALTIDWIVYSGCPKLGSSSYFVIDGGTGRSSPLDKSFSQYVQHIDPVLGDDTDGNKEHSTPLKYSAEFLLKHPCKHTVQLWAVPTTAVNCDGVPNHLDPVLSNEMTIWIDSPPGYQDPVDPFPGNPKTESSCSNGPAEPPTVGCPVDIANGKMYHQMVDLRIDGPLPIEFVRRYDSKYAGYPGVMGNGWQNNGMMHLQGLAATIDPFIGHMSQVFVDQQMRRVTFNCKNLPLQVRHPISGSPGVCNGVWWPDKIEHLTLTQDDDQHWHIKDKHGTIYDFEKANFLADGRLTAIHDRNNNTLTYTYYPDGKLYRITDGFSRYMELTYDANGHLFTLSAGARTVTYEILGDDLKKVTYPDGSFVSYTYESGHRLLTAVDSEGHVIEDHQYDPADPLHKVIHTESDGGNYAYTLTRTDPAQPTVRNERDFPITTIYTVNPLTGVATDRTGGPGCSSCGDAGDATHKTYDAYLNVTDIVDGLGTRTHMTYNGNGNILTRTENCILQSGVCQPNELSRTTSHTYDAFSLPTAIGVPTVGTCVDPISQQPITQRFTTLTRDPANGNLMNARITGCDRDQPLEVVTSYDYDGHGQVAIIDGPREVNDVTHFDYYLDDHTDINLRGRLHTVTIGAMPPTTYSGYDVFGNVGMVTDPNGVQTTFIYDARDRLRFHRIRVIPDQDTDELDMVSEYRYDSAGNLHRLRKPNCFEQGASCDYTFEYEYDGVNRLREIHDRYGNKIIYGYDHEGNRTREEFKDASNASQRVTDFKYDDFNRLEYVCYNPASVEDCGPAYDFFQYYADGNRLSERDPENHTTTYEYDALKRLWKSHQGPVGNTLTTEYGYDMLDGLNLVKDPRYLETTYKNDDLGRHRETTSPDTGITHDDYDEAGNLATSFDANGVTTTRTYDDLNRLLTTTYEHDPDPDIMYSYSYDSLDVLFGIGRRTGMTDPSGMTMYGYDRRGLLTSEEKAIEGLTFATGYDYDKSGNLSEIRYPSIDPTTRQGAVDYHYDDAERIDGVSVWYNGEPIDLAYSFEYKPFGPRTSLTFWNNLIDSRTFDTRYQLDTWNLVKPGVGNVLGYTHSFNTDGNLETITDDLDPTFVNNRSFGYDEIHRLTVATGPWGGGTGCDGNQTYTYDNSGNRTCKDDVSPLTRYEYVPGKNRLDRVTVDGLPIASYAYDDNGNTTSDGAHTYQYSNANRLAMVDGGGTLYDYDGENRRVRKTNTQTRFAFYDPSGRILTEFSTNVEVYGGATYGQDYVHLPDAPIARVDWSDVPNPDYYPCHPRPGVLCPPPRIEIADLLYYHTDHLGTPIAMTDQSGEMVWRAEYLPFGELFSNEIAQASNNLRFPGQYFDEETGLHQNWFRDYSPKTGRYQEADPIGFHGGDLSLFAYARSHPTAWTDPMGLADDAGPQQLLWEWVSGTGPSSHFFVDGDPFTEDLRESGYIKRFVKHVCNGEVPLRGREPRELTGWKGVPVFVGDVSALWLYGLNSLTPARFMGSYDLRYSVTSGILNIEVSNPTTISSLTHPPLSKYIPYWNRLVANPLNRVVATGPMSKTMQFADFHVNLHEACSCSQ